MNAIYWKSFAEALAVIVLLVAILLASGLYSIPQKKFIVASFEGGKPIHSPAKVWFQNPKQKPPKKTKAALVSRASISQLIVKYSFQMKEPI